MEEVLQKLQQQYQLLQTEYQKGMDAERRALENSVYQYFSETGKRLPKFIRDGATTGQSTSIKHKGAKKKACDFGLLDLPDLDIDALKFKSARIAFTKSIGFSTVRDMNFLFYQFLDDMIYASKLDRQLELRSHLPVADSNADGCAISHNGYPLGAVEVKMPGKWNLDQNLGQLYDNMMRIKSFYGIRSVFGILTNFEKWHICWLPDSDAAATATNLDYFLETVTPTSSVRRDIYISREYSSSESELAFALCSVLKKIGKNIGCIDLVPLASPTRPYMVLSRSKSYLSWKHGFCQPITLVPPSRTAKKFYLLRDFGGGADGRVWLGCSEAGNLAVVKILRKSSESEMSDNLNADIEVKYWHSCGLSSVFSGKFAGRYAIVMPLGFHYKNRYHLDNAWLKAETEGFEGNIKYLLEFQGLIEGILSTDVLDGCIARCADAGIVHNDIEWRHTAIFPKFCEINKNKNKKKKKKKFGLWTEQRSDEESLELSIEFAFIDLGRMTKLSGTDLAADRQAAIVEMNVEKERLISEEL